MSSFSNRFSAMSAVLLGALAIAVAALGWQASRTDADAILAQSSLVDCQKLAHQIQALQRGPQKAELTQRPVEELSQLVESWTTQAGIESERLLRVEPHPPRRVGDTDYLEQGAKVELRDVTLLQLAKFADMATRPGEQLRMTDLRLTAPRQETSESSAAETWQAELVLTSLVYAPKGSSR